MNLLKRDDEAGSMSKVNTVSVLQDARVFNSSPISPRKCREILTKLIYLLHTGDQFSHRNATELFFGISKLFQSPDPNLRQMVYLALKELAPYAQDIIMVTSSIMKDTTGGDALYRPNAVRTLCRVLDAHAIPTIDRLIRAAIVDRNRSVSSAALVSAYHLFPIAKTAVKQWQNETQEAASSPKSSGKPGGSLLTQYHAIGLLYQMRSHDRMALVKMTQMFKPSSTNLNFPAALMLMVRIAAKLAEDDPNMRKQMIQYLLDCLRHKSELVSIEAAKAICNLSDVSDSEIAKVVEVLQPLLASSALRVPSQFAAIRILHSIASFKPEAVKPCNSDIEILITNSNRSIATFAITTLLKTGNESSVDHLMKQITSLMTEISDEFRVTIVEAMRTLCLKFPSKHASMLSFLSGILRDEGGYDFKRAIVESMFDLIKFVPDSKEEALAHLCEFIEDCEYTKLAIRVLHVLGVEGPKATNPTKYIRYIYNRVVLENALVRAAAVTALAKFGVGQTDDALKASVHVLLSRCLDDVDDEVRDRAVFNLNLMAQESDAATPFVRHDSMFSLPILEHQLVMYVTSDKEGFSTPFDLSGVPVVTREQADAEDRTKKLTTTIPTLKNQGETKATSDAVSEAKTQSERQNAFLATIQAIREFAPYGAPLSSSLSVELTEADTEYTVSVVKHIFKSHIVLQFDITNTLPDTVLTDVTVVSVPDSSDGAELEEDFILPASKLITNQTGTVYVAFKRLLPDTSPFLCLSFSNTLKFTSREIDSSTNEPEETGYDDEYQVEEFELTGSDYVFPAYTTDFESIWPKHMENTAVETLSLSGVDSIADAIEQVHKTLNLEPLDGSARNASKTSHTMLLYGKTIAGGEVIAQARFAHHQTDIIMKLEVRAQDEGIAELLVNSFS